jgi:hypothetical protein
MVELKEGEESSALSAQVDSENKASKGDILETSAPVDEKGNVKGPGSSKTIIIAAAAIALIIIAIVFLLAFQYFNSRERYLQADENIKEARIEREKVCYIILSGEVNLSQVDSLDLIFYDEQGSEYVYLVNSLVEEQEVSASDIRLENFKNIVEVKALINYVQPETPEETPAPPANDTTNPPDDGGDHGGNSGGGDGGGGNNDTISCDDECIGEGLYCNGKMPYNCSLGDDGCYHRTNLTVCGLGEQCLNGTCYSFANCTSDAECGSDGCYDGEFRDYYCNSSGNCSYQDITTAENLTNNNCADGIDNDCDGQTDSSDSGCIAIMCGDGVCHSSENCSSCLGDCLCGSGEECVNGVCVIIPECTTDAECGSDGCSGDSYIDYSCDSGECNSVSDDCSDCSCSCGGYSTDETTNNGNCADGIDNDCDGQTDGMDGGCAVDDCGDGTCAGDEDCSTCPDDCGCGAGYYCDAGACIQGRVFYLDPIGGDTSNGDGSQTSPWGNLSSVVDAGYFNGNTIRSGDVLRLRSGYHGYFQTDKFLSYRQNSDYITIEADAGENPRLSGIGCKYCSYWKFKGLEISPSFSGPLTPHTATGGSPSIVYGYGNDHLIFEDNHVYSAPDSVARNWNSKDWTNLTFNGFHVGNDGSDLVFRNNKIENVVSGATSIGQRGIFENNIVDGYGSDGISSLGSNCLVKNNTVINTFAADSEWSHYWHTDCFQTSGYHTISNTRIIDNFCHARPDPDRDFVNGAGGSQGYFGGGLNNFTIANNVFAVTNLVHGISPDHMSQQNVVIENNTLITPYGLDYYSSPDPPDIQLNDMLGNIIIRNNIAGSFPGSNPSSNIVSENNVHLLDYNPGNQLQYAYPEVFVDHANGDERPLINGPLCDGSINGKAGVAVGALPCSCTSDNQCEEIYGSGSTCNSQQKCEGGVNTESPQQSSFFSTIWGWIKGLF